MSTLNLCLEQKESIINSHLINAISGVMEYCMIFQLLNGDVRKFALFQDLSLTKSNKPSFSFQTLMSVLPKDFLSRLYRVHSAVVCFCGNRLLLIDIKFYKNQFSGPFGNFENTT